MTNHALFDRTHTLVVPDNTDEAPLYTTRVVDCDIQCVPNDFLLKVNGIEALMNAPTASSQDRWQNIASAIGHMLHAISPDNGSDDNEQIALTPGRIIVPMEPSPRQIDKFYHNVLDTMAIRR